LELVDFSIFQYFIRQVEPILWALHELGYKVCRKNDALASDQNAFSFRILCNLSDVIFHDKSKLIFFSINQLLVHLSTITIQKWRLKIISKLFELSAIYITEFASRCRLWKIGNAGRWTSKSLRECHDFRREVLFTTM